MGESAGNEANQPVPEPSTHFTDEPVPIGRLEFGRQLVASIGYQLGQAIHLLRRERREGRGG